VPILDAAGAIGVLEALDGRRGTFSLHDIDLATSIAGAVAAAVGRGRLANDVRTVLERGVRDLAGTHAGDADSAAVEALVRRATADLPADDDATWRLADRIARLRDADPESIDLAIEWLDALLRHGAPGRHGR
jgi:GAF domain-containing protein